METLERPSRAMVITPHPDDAESGCGGTIARWIQEGTEVVYVVCTNGDKGTEDPEMTSEMLAIIREKEQQDAADAVGVKEVVFLRHRDGELEDNREFRYELVRAIRQFRPDVVFCTDPFRRSFYLHRDHRIVGQVTLDAVFPYARDRLHFVELAEEGFLPHKVGRVLMWGSEESDRFVDIKDMLDLKIKALMCHVSQVGGPDRNISGFVRDWARRQGEKCDIEFAESFRCMDLRR
jgi:LmbE family N-acetylglucosaminyl deacetylase